MKVEGLMFSVECKISLNSVDLVSTHTSSRVLGYYVLNSLNYGLKNCFFV